MLLLLALVLALPSAMSAKEVVRALDGAKAGCPMKLVYDPAVFAFDPKAALSFATPDFAELLDAQGISGIGRFTDPKTGRTWHLLNSFCPDSDPYFLLLSPEGNGLDEVNAEGETLRLVSAGEFLVKQGCSLYFQIEHRYVWEGGRPVEREPEFYPVRRSTKSLKKLELFPTKGWSLPLSSIPAGTAVKVFGYYPNGRASRALVRSAAGQTGWVGLGPDLLEGVGLAAGTEQSPARRASGCRPRPAACRTPDLSCGP